MPLYRYRCTDCGHEQEDMRLIACRDYPSECQGCGGKAVRVFEPCAIFRCCDIWGTHTARDILGPKSDRVVVTKGAAKITPRQ